MVHHTSASSYQKMGTVIVGLRGVQAVPPNRVPWHQGTQSFTGAGGLESDDDDEWGN